MHEVYNGNKFKNFKNPAAFKREKIKQKKLKYSVLVSINKEVIAQRLGL